MAGEQHLLDGVIAKGRQENASLRSSCSRLQDELNSLRTQCQVLGCSFICFAVESLGCGVLGFLLGQGRKVLVSANPPSRKKVEGQIIALLRQ